MQDSATWYSDARKYWSTIDCDVDGMLGGYGTISEIDFMGSSEFIRRMKPASSLKACDCGAGIGRVTAGFLLKHFDNIDLVEQNPQFLLKAQVDLKVLGFDKRCRFINVGLQDFYPKMGEYNLIWCQWVLSHLTDIDLVAFLKRCKSSLIDGLIGIKENVCKTGIEYDVQDSSCTRSDCEWKRIFGKAGLVIQNEEVQTSFPSNLYPVKMYMLI